MSFKADGSTPGVDIGQYDVQEVGTGRWKATGTANPDGSEWAVNFEARFDHGQFAITKICIELDPIAIAGDGTGGTLTFPPVYPQGGITASVLRRVPLGQIGKAIRTLIVDDTRILDRTTQVEIPVRRLAADEVVESKKPVGRKRLPDALYRQIAEDTIQFANDGKGRIHRRMADKHGVSESTIRDRIRGSSDFGGVDGGE